MSEKPLEPLALVDDAEIGALLDAARAAQSLSSDEKLARWLGVSDQAIYRWRRGQIDRSARVMLTLCNILQPVSSS